MTLFVVARAYLKSLPPKNVVYHTVNSVTKGGRFPRTPTHPGKRYSISLYKHDGRFRQDKGGVGLCIDKQSCCVYWLLPPGSSNQAAGLSSTCRVEIEFHIKRLTKGKTCTSTRLHSITKIVTSRHYACSCRRACLQSFNRASNISCVRSRCNKHRAKH